MPVASTDIKTYLSGGASNAVPAASLGGAKSSTEISQVSTLNNLFDDVSDTEAASGDTEYRCIYITNTNGSSALSSAAVYIASNTPSSDTAVQIGLDPAGTGTATTIANENTAPAGVTFSSAANSGAALAIGTLGAGQSVGLWIKRAVDADAAAAASDPVSIRVTGTP